MGSSNLTSQSYRSKPGIDLKERCFQFSVSVLQFIGEMPDRPLCRSVLDQLLRSATSIGADVHEAKSASSRRDFAHYYEIALKSANETVYWLQLTDVAFNNRRQDTARLRTEAEELSRIIAASLLTLKDKRKS